MTTIITVKEAIVSIMAEKLREYYMRGIRDARIEADENSMPSILEDFNAGDFSSAQDKLVWLKIARDILGI